MRCQRADVPLVIDSQESARSFFAGCMAKADPSVETVWVAHVDEQARCLHLSHHVGGSHTTDLPIQTIVTDAARHGSAGLLLAHNHPSGDPRPFRADCHATRKLAGVVEAMDCRLIDHLVFGSGGFSSFRALGLL
jgi:DNA repair protein RadC